MALPALGFPASALRRGAVAVAYAAVAFAAVWLVVDAAAPRPTAAISAGPTTTTMAAKPLVIEATYDVARWTVLVAGMAPAGPTVTDRRHWRGFVPAIATEVFVQAEAADPLVDDPGALRLTLGDGAASRQLTAWGEGSVAVVWRLDDGAPGKKP